MVKTPVVTILIATYNGEDYLPQQLDSLLQQSYPDWIALARDDGSQDRTAAILESYQDRYPQHFRVLPGGDRFGPKGNYGYLLAQADTAYLMFCDQDDVWLPDKVKLTLAQMKRLEDRYGPETPLLVHTDLKVVDQELGDLAESFWRFQHIAPEISRSLARLLVQNAVTGCAVMVNGALRDLALPIPEEAVLHDWWLALTAAALGQVDYLSQPTVLYRQHPDNDVGAKAWGLPYLATMIRQPGQVRGRLRDAQRQARAFSERFQPQLAPDRYQTLRTFGDLEAHNFLSRRWQLVRHGIFKSGFLRNLGMFALV